KRDNMVIPVPEAESNIAYYESIYPGEFKMPKQLIHIQPFSLNAEQLDYDLESEDEAFVNKLKKKIDISPLQFEEMIVQLEKGSGQQPVSLQEAKLLLKEDDELIREIYEYWIKKRKNCQRPSLISAVKQEKRDGSSTNDPYVAFRRRTEKMQTRKNRKNDEASYEKMLKLRRDLSHAVTILEMIKRREKSKRELLHLTLEIMEKRYNLGDYNGEIMSEVMVHQQPITPTYAVPVISVANSTQFKHPESMELKEFKINKQEKADAIRPKRKYEKKPKIVPSSVALATQQSTPAALNQYDFPSSDEEPLSHVLSGSSEVEEENDPDGPFAFHRKAGCQYYAPHLEQTGDLLWNSPKEATLGDEHYRYCLTTLTVPHRCIGFSRRRGLQIQLMFRGEGPHTLPSAYLQLRLIVDLSPSLGKELRGISQALSKTKSHWINVLCLTPVHFEHSLLRGAHIRSTYFDTVFSHFIFSSAFTAEQYHHHQQQLALMQKQQLAQIHQQQANSNSANSSQGFISKTLDSVSAQFAASALITSEQLMGFRMKDDVVLGIGMNGILQSSGLYKGLHFSSTLPTSLVHTSSSIAGSAILQPSNITETLSSHSALSHHVTAANSTTTQVLFGNNIRLTVPSSVATANSINMLNACHMPKTLSAVPSSALKLAAANCQVPASSSVNTVSRENHETEKSALNNIADNAVAMEVT
uniref:Enhancer of polycomb C-terminal domain-containing protein n=2 Tax=Pseudonaja textilis TaxID=8673 RepID=A0A670ZQY6_PSETE